MIFPQRFIKNVFEWLGFEIKRSHKNFFRDPSSFPKGEQFVDRFREIISDPINLLIERHPTAGFLDNNGNVILHNGLKVPTKGSFSYYSDFSEVLILNRGVHEPLEEYCFQELLKKPAGDGPVMLELGAYWGHYSMWFASKVEHAKCFLVEPNQHNLEVGKRNFRNNGYAGTFINSFVGDGHFTVDDFMMSHDIDYIYLLHSDIQGFEVEMLRGSHRALSDNSIGYLFVSTHSEYIHSECVNILKSYLYRIEVSSGYDTHTTGYDGFILASSVKVDQLFDKFAPIGRVDIAKSSPDELVEYVRRTWSKERSN